MLAVDRFFGLFAPHLCVACEKEGSLLCEDCLQTAGDPVMSRCAGCHALTKNNKTCATCKSWLKVDAVHIATSYEGVYELLIHSLKFDCKRQACEPIAQIMFENSNLDSDTILCPLPTAPSRIRLRGFDHTDLIAKRLYKLTGLESSQLLKRHSNVRQLGSNRTKRIQQMELEFYSNSPEKIKGKKIVLVDDVITTGASLAAAAKVLKDAGAKEIQALIFAQKI